MSGERVPAGGWSPLAFQGIVMDVTREDSRSQNQSSKEPGRLGPGLIIDGEVFAGEDLVLEGQLVGTLQAPDHAVTVAAGAVVRGRLFARMVLIDGTVQGGVTATGLIEIGSAARIEADLSAPSIAIAHGASVNGKIDMRRVEAATRVARYRLERSAEDRKAGQAS
jgi:cytoskeletal protein CcmA (bactofilin family)